MASRVKSRPFVLGSWRFRETLKQVILAIALFAMVCVFLFPYYYMITSSFREPFYNFDTSVPDFSPPVPPRIDSYVKILSTKLWGMEEKGALGAFALGFQNTIIFCVTIVGGSTLTSALAAYAFAKHDFPGRRFIFYVFLYSMIVPGEVTFVPKYVMFHNWHLLGTYWVLIIPGIIGAGGWFLMRMFMSTIPNAYLDAARIDGASEWLVIRHVIFPQSQPVIFTYMLMTFLGVWNDLMGPLLFINDPKKYTLQLVLYLIQLNYTFQYGWGYGDPTGLRMQMLFAGMVVGSAPTILLFAIFQKRITKGITITGLKL